MELFTYLMAKNDHNTSVKKDLFSYLLGKNQSGTYQEYTGTSLSISNTKKGKMKLDLYGNTSQTGTPTPSSPIPVNVVSGDNTIKVCGKNLFDNITENKLITSDGAISNNASWNLGDYIKVQPNTKYTFSRYDGTGQSLMIAEYNSSKTFIQRDTQGGIAAITPYTITTTATTEYVRLNYDNTKGNTLLQFELGETATPYEPYTSTSYPIHLGEYELCKISTYQDRFIKTTGKNLCNITSGLPYNFVSGLPGSASTNISVNSFDSTNLSYTSNVAGYQYILTNVIQLKPSTQYTIKFSRTTTATNNQWFIYDYDNGTYSVNYRDNNTNTLEKTFTTNNLGQIALAFGYGNVTGATTISNIMLNEGSTPLPYEPYGTNEWYLEKKIGKVVLDGSENWATWYQTSNSNIGFYYHPTGFAKLGVEAELNGALLCDNFSEPTTRYSLYIGEKEGIKQCGGTGTQYIALGLAKTSLTDWTTNTKAVESLKSWLSSHNALVYYCLDTPTYTQITDTLKDELEAVWRANSYKGTTNISQINNDLPFNLDVEIKVGS